MNFERPRETPGGRMPADDHVMRPTECPECRSKAIGTLAKVITADTYWRCQTCGAVWNETRHRNNAPRRRW
jgi:DNA-directed RNA polymerase subunit RPC12/RpoP